MDSSVSVSPFVSLKTASASFLSNEPLIAKRPLPQCKLCVAIPVRNEADAIGATLKALAHQVDLAGKPLAPCYEILLFANNCTDETVCIAHQFAKAHPRLALHVVDRQLPHAQSYVGRARQLVMDEAYRRMVSLGGRGAIAATDGDTQVSSTWVAANLFEIARGADAVGGRILYNKKDLALLTPEARVYRLRSFGYSYLTAKLEYYLDPDISEFPCRHHQHNGASLAVSADAYRRAGGLPATRTPEDTAFYRALRRVDARFCHSSLVRVTTSARLQGRTDIGAANQLSEWVNLGLNLGRSRHQFFVNSAAAVENRLVSRRLLKITWQRLTSGEQLLAEDARTLAHQLGVESQWLASELNQHSFFGQLVERVEQRQQAEGVWQQRWPKVEIGSAITALRLRLRKIAQEQAMLARINQADTAQRCIPIRGATARGTVARKPREHHLL